MVFEDLCIIFFSVLVCKVLEPPMSVFLSLKEIECSF